MRRRFTKLLCLSICILNIFALLMIPVSANSAQTEWSGRDSSGAAVISGNCPIVVTNEVLTFDINVLPEYYHPNVDDFIKYDAKVTAEYTFYNPSDLTVTAKLAFPFDSDPAYFPTGEGASDADRYQITVNGAVVEKKVRHTVGEYTGFDLNKELASLSDEYITDDFFKPDMLVTKYVYSIPEDSRLRTEGGKYVAFDFDNNNRNTRIYIPKGYGTMNEDGSMRLKKKATSASSFVFYVIGDPLSSMPVCRIYQNSDVKDGEELDIPVTFKSTSQMTLEELILANWSEDDVMSRVDWYNASVTEFMESTQNKNFAWCSFNCNPRSSRNIIEWYEYNITLAPGESIVNTVTVPMYPDVNANYRPEVYTYNYYLTPAKTWASFGNLEIIINTPYYMLGSSLDGFTKTENGYRLSLNGLPDKDLRFYLSESEDPVTKSGTKWSEVQRRNARRAAIKEFFADYGLYIGIAFGVVGVGAAVIIIKKEFES